MKFPGSALLKQVRGDEHAYSIPPDIVATLGFVALADLVLLSAQVPPPVRALVGLPLLFFLPGYAAVTALFPERPVPDERSVDGGEPVLGPAGGSSVTLPERLALGFGLSLAIVPVLAVGLAATGQGFGLVAELGTVSAVVVAGTLVGWARRRAVPPDRRFQPPLWTWPPAVLGPAEESSWVDRVLRVALVLATVLAAAMLTYALVAPPPSSGYTQLSLLTETDGGDLVADGYPSELAAGETRSVVVAVDNREGELEQYTVVAQLQRVRTDGSGVTVVESEPIARQRLTVEAGERVTRSLSITPRMEGEDLRMAVLLYRGSPPDDPDTDSAYRYTYIWLDVHGGNETGST